MTTKKVLKKIVKNGVEIHLPQNNVFVITEDKLTKTTTETKGVAPYNTDYYYTNYQISATAGVKWIEGALYTFMINTKTTASAYRNVRVQIGTGSYIPVMSSSGTILGGSSYFTKANDRIYQYSTRYESGGALHLITDSNTTYSSMSADEGKTGTATSARTVRADYLKEIIEYHAGNLHDSSKQDKLESGTNIKTVNGNSLLGSGNITLNDVKVSATAPSSPTEGMVWYDTTNDQLKVYDGTNWQVTGKEYNAGPGISIGQYQDYSAMRGPCPVGFHVPSKDEWIALCGILTTTFSMTADYTTMGTYLKMPKAGSRSAIDSDVSGVGSSGRYWSYTPIGDYNASSLYFHSSGISTSSNAGRGNGYSVRCFKDTPTIPTSSWTTLYDGSSVATGAGVFYNAINGLISVSGDGQTWYTIMDKNLGATTVYNQGDTETDANCGYFYQWGNNYGFPHSGNVTNSSTTVNASNYGPGNYYSSSTFITSMYRDSSKNNNLWGNTTGVVTINNAITNTGVLSVNGQTGDVSLYSTITVTLTSAGWSSNSQTVSATGVTASNSVIVSPAPTSITNYTDAKIYCSAQGSNSLTFTCDTVPTNNITVNVIILN